MVPSRKGGRHGLQRSGHRLRPDTEQGKPLAMTSAGIVVKIEFSFPPSETRLFDFVSLFDLIDRKVTHMDM